MVGGFAHPIILFADAFNLAIADIAVEALAMLAVDDNPLHKILDAPHQAPGRALPALEILDRAREDPRFDNLFDSPGVGNTGIVLRSSTARAALLEHFHTFDIGCPDNASEKLNELAKAAVLLLVAVNPPGTKYGIDQYLAHQITFVWSARVLIPILSPAAMQTLLRAVWLIMLLRHITQLRPKIVPARLGGGSLPVDGPSEEW